MITIQGSCNGNTDTSNQLTLLAKSTSHILHNYIFWPTIYYILVNVIRNLETLGTADVIKL